MFGFLKSKREKERVEAEGIIKEMHSYYYAAKERFPGKKEIFYLALAWALFAKKNYPEKYQRRELAGMFFLGMAVASIHSLLPSPDSINAMAIHMIHKVHLSIENEYAAEYERLLSEVKVTPEYAEKAGKENFEYFQEVEAELEGLSDLN